MWMKSHGGPGLWRRLLTAVGGALKRGMLGKSGHDYMKQFAASDEYWDEALAAQLGWPQKQPRKPDADRFENPGGPPQPEFEPVHGWTKRQLDDYLARNPGYRSTYQTQLQGTQCQPH